MHVVVVVWYHPRRCCCCKANAHVVCIKNKYKKDLFLVYILLRNMMMILCLSVYLKLNKVTIIYTVFTSRRALHFVCVSRCYLPYTGIFWYCFLCYFCGTEWILRGVREWFSWNVERRRILLERNICYRIVFYPDVLQFIYLFSTYLFS